MSSIYKIQFLTTMYVYASNLEEARDIGRDYLIDEVSNGAYEEFDIQEMSVVDVPSMDDEVLKSLPWRSEYSPVDSTKNQTVGEILCLKKGKFS